MRETLFACLTTPRSVILDRCKPCRCVLKLISRSDILLVASDRRLIAFRSCRLPSIALNRVRGICRAKAIRCR